MVPPELTDTDKEYTIDVARQDPNKLQIYDLDFKDENSEGILRDLVIVNQSGQADMTRRIISMTMAAQMFEEEGHTNIKLSDGIVQAYMDVYQDKKLAIGALRKNKETAKALLNDTIFFDKPNGLELLLVLVFFMGIDDGGSKEVIAAQGGGDHVPNRQQ